MINQVNESHVEPLCRRVVVLVAMREPRRNHRNERVAAHLRGTEAVATVQDDRKHWVGNA